MRFQLHLLAFFLMILMVSCSNPLGTHVSVQAPYAPTQSTAASTLAAVSPVNGPLLGGTLITITGTNFVAGTTVTVGGQNCTSVVILSATSLTCITPGHFAGWVNIVVTTPDSQTSTLQYAFDYIGSGNPHGDFGVASGGGTATSSSLKLRGLAGGMASQVQPTGTTVRLYPGLINVTVSH